MLFTQPVKIMRLEVDGGQYEINLKPHNFDGHSRYYVMLVEKILLWSSLHTYTNRIRRRELPIKRP